MPSLLIYGLVGTMFTLLVNTSRADEPVSYDEQIAALQAQLADVQAQLDRLATVPVQKYDPYQVGKDKKKTVDPTPPVPTPPVPMPISDPSAGACSGASGGLFSRIRARRQGGGGCGIFRGRFGRRGGCG